MMWRCKQRVRHGWMVGVAVVTWVGLSQAGFTEQPLKQLPEDVVSVSFAWVALPQAVVEVTKDHGPLAGISWGLIKGSSEVVARVMSLVEKEPSFEGTTQTPPSQDVFAHRDDGRLSWLNLQDGGAREVHREPVLLHYTF